MDKDKRTSCFVLVGRFCRHCVYAGSMGDGVAMRNKPEYFIFGIVGLVWLCVIACVMAGA